MELQGPEAARLRLTLTGWEGHGHWLEVRLDAALEGKRWTASFPCLTTHDVMRLARWFDELAKGRKRKRVDFLEPNVSFELLDLSDRSATFRAYLGMEFRPEHMSDSSQDCSIRLAASLRQQLDGLERKRTREFLHETDRNDT